MIFHHRLFLDFWVEICNCKTYIRHKKRIHRTNSSAFIVDTDKSCIASRFCGATEIIFSAHFSHGAKHLSYIDLKLSKSLACKVVLIARQRKKDTTPKNKRNHHDKDNIPISCSSLVHTLFLRNPLNKDSASYLPYVSLSSYGARNVSYCC